MEISGLRRQEKKQELRGIGEALMCLSDLSVIENARNQCKAAE